VRPYRGTLLTPTRLYLVAFVVTNIGVGGFTLATGLVLFKETGSAGTFSALVATEYALGFVGQFVGGSVLDRFDVLQVALWSNGLRSAAVLLAGAFGLVTGGQGLLVAAFLVSGFIRPLYRSASFALVPRVCPPDDLPRVNGLRFGLLQVAQIGGLLVVAVLITAIPSPGVVATVGCFFLTGTIVLSLLRGQPGVSFAPVGGAAHPPAPVGGAAHPPAPSGGAAGAVALRPAGGGVARAVTAGLRSLLVTWREVGAVFRAVPSVLVHLSIACVAPVVVSLMTILVAPVNTALHGGSLGIALLDGGVTVGALASILAVRRLDRTRFAAAIGVAIAVIAAALATLALAGHIWLAAFAFFGVGVGSAGAASLLDTLLQLRTDRALIGRVSVSQEFVVSVSALLLLPFTGTAVANWGFHATSAVFALVVAAALAALLVAAARLRADLFERRLSLQPVLSSRRGT
jgi:MFS transporter